MTMSPVTTVTAGDTEETHPAFLGGFAIGPCRAWAHGCLIINRGRPRWRIRVVPLILSLIERRILYRPARCRYFVFQSRSRVLLLLLVHGLIVIGPSYTGSVLVTTGVTGP